MGPRSRSRTAPRPAGARLDELARWAAAQARTPPRPLRYGPEPDQVADLRLPEAGGAPPLAVLLHGGFWRAAYTRTLMDALGVDLAARGWASLNVEYRRVGCGGGMPQTLEDIAGAVALLAGPDAPLRRDRLVVVGHSAGGQLALLAGELPAVGAVISLAGVCDLHAGFRAGIGDGAVGAFLGGSPQEVPERYLRADPLGRAPVPARVLLAHGDADDRVPVEHSRRYAASAGEGTELLELAGVDHFALIDPRTDAWRAVAARLPELAAASPPGGGAATSGSHRGEPGRVTRHTAK
jgi:acetyl esterase/lipase